ncbi:hypothetical protein LINPERPRIM_LOCUS35264 [Linum perenne]
MGFSRENNRSCQGLNGKSFPQYEQLHAVFGTSHATGQGVVAANEDVPPLSERDSAMMNDVDTNNLDDEGMVKFMDDIINEVVACQRQIVFVVNNLLTLKILLMGAPTKVLLVKGGPLLGVSSLSSQFQS